MSVNKIVRVEIAPEAIYFQRTLKLIIFEDGTQSSGSRLRGHRVSDRRVDKLLDILPIPSSIQWYHDNLEVTP